MGGQAFKATTYAAPTSAKTEVHASSLTPVEDLPAPNTPDFKVDPADTDDLVTRLVKREVTGVQAAIHSVDKRIEQLHSGLREAEARKASLEAQVQKYASFLS